MKKYTLDIPMNQWIISLEVSILINIIYHNSCKYNTYKRILESFPTNHS
jgi:hypothetical protein